MPHTHDWKLTIKTCQFEKKSIVHLRLIEDTHFQISKLNNFCIPINHINCSNKKGLTNFDRFFISYLASNIENITVLGKIRLVKVRFGLFVILKWWNFKCSHNTERINGIWDPAQAALAKRGFSIRGLDYSRT